MIYTTCPRTIHNTEPFAAPCENCIDPLGGRKLVKEHTPRPACQKCGTYLDCHGEKCTYEAGWS